MPWKSLNKYVQRSRIIAASPLSTDLSFNFCLYSSHFLDTTELNAITRGEFSD